MASSKSVKTDLVRFINCTVYNKMGQVISKISKVQMIFKVNHNGEAEHDKHKKQAKKNGSDDSRKG